jgi:ABC-type multidrug transport system ATPase subunit
MIHVRDLTKSYADLRRGQFVALAGISLDALAGQIYGLLGPNGAGKTSALRILSTVLRPTSGTATVNGYDVLTQPSLVRHQIGFVSTNTAVYDRMTAWEWSSTSAGCMAWRRTCCASGWKESSRGSRCKRSGICSDQKCPPA